MVIEAADIEPVLDTSIKRLIESPGARAASTVEKPAVSPDCEEGAMISFKVAVETDCGVMLVARAWRAARTDWLARVMPPTAVRHSARAKAVRLGSALCFAAFALLERFLPDTFDSFLVDFVGFSYLVFQ